MTHREPGHVFESLWHEVLQVTTMLLFVLSSIATSRQKHYKGTGQTRGIELPGLPEICLIPCIFNVPDDELYGPIGIAAQMAYKGWIADVFGLWENRFRRKLQDSFGKNSIPPEFDAFGDLRLIRNDLVHSGAASAERSGKCAILKWFTPGDSIVLGTRHVFDFLNQTGVLSLGGRPQETEGRYRGCVLVPHLDSDKLLKWKPKPELVSVRTHNDGRQHDSPYKGVTVVFSNGLFSNTPFPVTSERHWVALGNACINKAGDLQFCDGTIVDSDRLYEGAVAVQQPRKDGDGRPRLPVAGPWIQFRR